MLFVDIKCLLGMVLYILKQCYTVKISYSSSNVHTAFYENEFECPFVKVDIFHNKYQSTTLVRLCITEVANKKRTTVCSYNYT